MCGYRVGCRKEPKVVYGIPVVVVGDQQSLRNVESLAIKVNRVQWMYDILSAYWYTLDCRPAERKKGNADVLPRLPSPGTKADRQPDVHLSDPTAVDVCIIGAGGVYLARLTNLPTSSLVHG